MTTSRVLLCAVAATLTIAGCGDNLEAPGPDTLAVDPTSVVLHVGESVQVTATYGKHGASLTGGDMKWSSSDPGRATVRGTGTSATITGVAAGAATITASGDDLTAAVEVTIAPATLAGIAITPPAPSLPAGTTKTLSVIATYSDGTTTDVTASVAWVIAEPSIVAVDGTTLTARVKGDTTLTAMFMGRFSSTHVFVTDPPDVGPWVAAPGFAGRPCNDAVKFSMASDAVYVCTTANGVVRGTVAADTSISFSAPNTGVTNLQGLAIAAHTVNPTTMMYMAVPSAGISNWFRSSDSATTFSAFSLLDSAGTPRFLYAGRLQSMVGNILGSWDPGTAGTPQAVVIVGMNPPTGVHPVATATGIVHAVAGSAANNLYVAVLGQTPAGAPATGGVFHSTDAAVTWAETDTGIAAADKDHVASLAIDPTNPLILYAGVRGGGLVYKTIDGGTTWTASAAGIPTRAFVSVVYVSPDSTTVYAATDLGLYKTIDGGTTWTLAGFLGRSVLGIAQSSAAASLILAGVDDAVGLYRAQ